MRITYILRLCKKTPFVPTIHHLPPKHETYYQNKTKPPDYMRKEKRKKRERREGRSEERRREVQTHGRKKEEETSWVGGIGGRPWMETSWVCKPTTGLGLFDLGLAGLGFTGHRDPWLQQLYFLIFSDGSCFVSCFLIFFFFGFSYSSDDF
jgi:hypothetical protein